MSKKISIFSVVLFSALCLWAIAAWGTAAAGPTGPQPEAEPAGAAASIDLLIQSFTISPPNAALYEPVTFTIEACNAPGSDPVTGRRVYLYVDPPNQPPLTTTRETKPFVMYVSWPGGDCFQMEYGGFTFGQSGPHVAYAWVDPYERIAESNESNNLSTLQINIPAEGEDLFEPDNTCNQAAEIAVNGAAQIHDFAPQGDVDWVKFQATAGQWYTLTSAGSGQAAYPFFEVWDSCVVPPLPAFGAASSIYEIRWKTATSGWYYLKLENDLDTYDAAQSGYRLAIRSAAAITGVQPYVNALSPASGYNDRNAHVVITGTNFSAESRATLCPYQTGQCQACVFGLDNASWQGLNLFAVAPANLPQGSYCLAVTNLGGKVGTLPDAFTVLPGQPDLRRVYPVQGYANLPADLNIYGFNFHPGITLSLGGMELENVVVVNQTYLRATTPARLPPGSHTLQALYASGQPDQLVDAYTVLSSEEDLFAQAQELWADPAAPHVHEMVRLGLNVHRISGTAALQGLPVRFYANNQMLGDVNVLALPVTGSQSSAWLEWLPPQAGDYQIRAVIDPLNSVVEINKANNAVTRSLTVLGAAADKLAPHVDWLLIKTSPTAATGSDEVDDGLVYLAAGATDYPLVGSEGVSHLRYIEFEYNPAASLWIPVQDSGWVVSDTVNANAYRWQLTQASGVHYIQAWARDAAGNVSVYPNQKKVNYLRPNEWVSRNQVRIYQKTLGQGQTLHVVVTPVQGDADLYIWPPNWKEGQPPWVSNVTGQQVDEMQFSAPVSGVYSIEIYGYTSAEYELDMTVSSRLRLSRQWVRGGVDPNKPQRQQPAIGSEGKLGEPPTILNTAQSPQILISGPAEGLISQTHTFTATLTLGTLVLPVTYTWQASGQTAVTHPASSATTDSASFDWSTPGVKTVTVTASNAGGLVSATHTITISTPSSNTPLQTVTIAGPTQGAVNTVYTFTAAIVPITATTPIVYTWSPPPASGQGSPSATYSWAQAITQTIMLTATNLGGTSVVSDTHTIVVRAAPPADFYVYLPLTLKGYQ